MTLHLPRIRSTGTWRDRHISSPSSGRPSRTPIWRRTRARADLSQPHVAFPDGARIPSLPHAAFSQHASAGTLLKTRPLTWEGRL
jgi:hypothetical protein